MEQGATGVLELILIGAAAAAVGLLAGALLGAWYADKKLRLHYQDVRGEIVRLRAVTEEKFSGDDPRLDDLLENLHAAANTAYAAVQAMEAQAIITRRKSEGSKEVIASSRHIIRMIDEYSGEAPQSYVIEPKKQAPEISPKAAPKVAPKVADERLRLADAAPPPAPAIDLPPAEMVDEAPVQKALAKKRAAELHQE